MWTGSGKRELKVQQVSSDYWKYVNTENVWQLVSSDRHRVCYSFETSSRYGHLTINAICHALSIAMWSMISTYGEPRGYEYLITDTVCIVNTWS
jgi:hypothetical protein